MARGSDAVLHASPGPSVQTMHGPVWPTGAAMGRLRPLGLGDVVLAPGYELGDWQKRNRARTLPHCVSHVRSRAVANLRRVAEGRDGDAPHIGWHFTDSDIYKVLEAAAWDSVRGSSQEADDFGHEAADLMARAQRPDGYLNSWFQGQHPELAWKDLRWGHELYCAGHLLQAAVASRRTGTAWDISGVADALVEHLLTTFSLDDEDGRLIGVCGHPEVETALVEFYRQTGDKRALQLAKRQVDLRGRSDVVMISSGLLGDDRFPMSYFLHHMPVRDRASATGHAVRELYLQAGIVDVAVETGDEELLGASEAVWEDLFTTKTYITGAHGSRHRDESIGDAYELPSDRAYGETCAAIASFQWNWRLLLATGRARYSEAMERVLWNIIAGAVSQQGTEFFYSNTLHLRTGHDGDDEDSPRHRLDWYGCPCCPPNLARLIASIQAYLLTRDPSGLQMHMPFNGTVATEVPGGSVSLKVRTGHPWEGTTHVEVERCSSSDSWELSVRTPEWASGMSVRLNGTPVEGSSDGPYIRVRRQWASGDHLEVSHSMPARVVRPHWRADAVRDCFAIERGPLVYCIEADDLDAASALEDVVLDNSQPLEMASQAPASLDGYVKVAITASGGLIEGTRDHLYNDVRAESPTVAPLNLTFVPYFARGNRPKAAMRVWVPSIRREGDGAQISLSLKEKQ